MKLGSLKAYWLNTEGEKGRTVYGFDLANGIEAVRESWSKKCEIEVTEFSEMDSGYAQAQMTITKPDGTKARACLSKSGLQKNLWAIVRESKTGKTHKLMDVITAKTEVQARSLIGLERLKRTYENTKVFDACKNGDKPWFEVETADGLRGWKVRDKATRQSWMAIKLEQS